MGNSPWGGKESGTTEGTAHTYIIHIYIYATYISNIYNLPHILIIYVSVYTHTHTHTQSPHVAPVHAGRSENQENK